MPEPQPLADAVGDFRFDLTLAAADEPPEGWADWPIVRTADPHPESKENH